MKTIDCRGMACPAPVITVKKALEESPAGICVVLDDGAPRENVTRFAKTRGFEISETCNTDSWTLQITDSNSPVIAPDLRVPVAGERILLITSDRIGDVSDLGALLMRNFLCTLLETAVRPDRLLFLNSGVLLTIHGSEVLEALQHLENLGVELASCGVCLDYFQKKDQLAVGRITNMFSTAEQLLGASSVIRL